MAGPVRVLVLGGSTEASALARRIAPLDTYDVTVSYAGRTRQRVHTPGTVRVGGFGGAAGLAHHLTTTRVELLVDATHPFAARMPQYAAAACALTGVPRLRLCRPPWGAVDGDRWHEVPNLDAAATFLEGLGARRVFLTTGRQDLAPFAGLHDVWFLVRAIEPPDQMPLANAALVLGRGPFDEASELELMTHHRVEVLVTKNSGGTATAAKLAAARALGLPVVMVVRPSLPAGPHVTTVDDAVAWLAGVAASGSGTKAAQDNRAGPAPASSLG